MSVTAGLLLFGGAFNPPHRTHHRILRAALAHLPVADALVLPSGHHPLKGDRDMASDEARLELCRLAFADLEGVTVSDREMRREGIAYTVDTLVEIAAEYPGRPLFLLVGADNLRILDDWHRHHELLRLCSLVTFPRRGYPIEPETLAAQDLSAEEILAVQRWVLDVEADDVSATGIRAALRRGEVPGELDPKVAARIQALGLYR